MGIKYMKETEEALKGIRLTEADLEKLKEGSKEASEDLLEGIDLNTLERELKTMEEEILNCPEAESCTICANTSCDCNPLK